jgi:hypothetical protein
MAKDIRPVTPMPAHKLGYRTKISAFKCKDMTMRELFIIDACVFLAQ